jgi:catechol 2,3-dioxygenase-like lactoylglutathione lyase family enzyme
VRVLRIVANIAAEEPARAHAFYGEALGLDVAMDLGWIVTFAGGAQPRVQLSVAREGGSGTAVPDLSIEVDDLDAALARLRQAGFEPEYGPVQEPWGVRRFFVRDPFGRLVNLLSHAAAGAAAR